MNLRLQEEANQPRFNKNEQNQDPNSIMPIRKKQKNKNKT